MDSYAIVIILLAVAIGLSPVAAKIKFPYPVLLLLTGIAVGFIPGFRVIPIDPEVVFLIFLPPMLYDAAYNISFKDFMRNLPTISTLAFTLVFVTTAAIAVAVHYCIGLSWPLSFVLGAILSPPDAIAATSVTKGLGLPSRTTTVLEGESLINDASALVALRFAVAAVGGSSFEPLNAVGAFALALVGGFVVGWLLSRIFKFISKRCFDKNVIVSLNLMLPFTAYLIAEEFHVSGVIAAVIVGLSIAQHKNHLPEQTVAHSKSVLDSVIFILGGLIFILIGLQFPQVLGNIPPKRFLPLIGCAFLIFIVALLIRMVTIFIHKQQVQKRYRLMKKQMECMDETGFERLKKLRHRFPHNTAFDDDGNLANIKSFLFTWKEAVIIGWSGMRGIVSLAAALSLPLVMKGGVDFPHRDTVLFLTVTTVIIMLVIQGVGLPILVRRLKISHPSE